MKLEQQIDKMILEAQKEQQNRNSENSFDYYRGQEVVLKKVKELLEESIYENWD